MCMIATMPSIVPGDFPDFRSQLRTLICSKYSYVILSRNLSSVPLVPLRSGLRTLVPYHRLVATTVFVVLAAACMSAL